MLGMQLTLLLARAVPQEVSFVLCCVCAICICTVQCQHCMLASTAHDLMLLTASRRTSLRLPLTHASWHGCSCLQLMAATSCDLVSLLTAFPVARASACSNFLSCLSTMFFVALHPDGVSCQFATIHKYARHPGIRICILLTLLPLCIPGGSQHNPCDAWQRGMARWIPAMSTSWSAATTL
jgi:hypothetical protein